MKAILLGSALLFLAATSESPLSLAQQGRTQRPKPKEKKAMDFAAFDWSKLEAERAETKKPWLEFVNNETMTCGVYRLAKGSKDGQSPHELDEVYYVVSGKAKFKAGDKTVDCKPGSVLFVKAKLEHRFFDIEEDLTTLVFFSKAKPPKAKGEKRDD